MLRNYCEFIMDIFFIYYNFSAKDIENILIFIYKIELVYTARKHRIRERYNKITVDVRNNIYTNTVLHNLQGKP